MAFGKNNDSNGGKSYRPTIYSAYRFNNAESSIDKTCLTFRYWKNTLVLVISPKKDSTDGTVSFDFDNGICIYLSHIKANILAEEIKAFLKEPGKYSNVGVASGSSIITLSDGSEFGYPGSNCLVIRRVDENGAVQASFAYEFKTNYHFAVRNYNESGSFDKVVDSYNTVEIESLVTLLEGYYNAMTGAIAASVVDSMHYDVSTTSNKIDSIMNHLGIEFSGRRGGNSNRSGRSSFFNNNGNVTPGENAASEFVSGGIEDLE